ncbi:uncharacterized protein LOC105394985 isoform X1 [Plutella xylostella]|uniref:uncharacterized protein LOC105394985 isoform X1 n=1 Tax=Plutella xylostella TaxID=51655 RepID=UPI00203267DD|nr:uncharacterized protein LOC105394985 isoform X1 [Plutella xylostella]
MSIKSNITLIDLSKQLPFEIDNELREKLCFAETLVISCCHDDRFEHDDTSEDVCTEPEAEPEGSEEIVEFQEAKEVKSYVEDEEELAEEEKEDDDYHFFFFPDCAKPAPKDSQATIIMQNGMPVINKFKKPSVKCTCPLDEDGQCKCFLKYPCKCGAKTAAECVCDQADIEKICICRPHKPNLSCKCHKAKICTCTGVVEPSCHCKKVKKVCVCDPTTYPYPVCPCKPCKCDHERPISPMCVCKPCVCDDTRSPAPVCICKPCICEGEEDPQPVCHCGDSESAATVHTKTWTYEMNEEASEEENFPEIVEQKASSIKCDCQKPDKCQCMAKGNKDPCTCPDQRCICGYLNTCLCGPPKLEHQRMGGSGEGSRESENESVCSCGLPPVCKCKGTTDNCKCFDKEPECTCGNPEDCQCFRTCECDDPCDCDKYAEKECQQCACLDPMKPGDLVCTCPQKKPTNQLVRVKTKDGYRWCHRVDPKHTFFDYGYDRFDLINKKSETSEKLKILGLYDKKDPTGDGAGETNDVNVPVYKKEVKKPSMDCCSTVGGMTISVQHLGEDKDKFLVEVVSNMSKEGAKTGSKLISIVDSNLHTMEESRTENITKKEKIREMRNYMSICETGYYNKVTSVCGEKTHIKRLNHSFETAHNFLLEGANMVLMRYFALIRHKGVVQTDTVLIAGEICESVYNCLGVSQAVVNGHPMFVVKVERHIITPTGAVHQTLTVLTLRGYTISQEWSDTSYVIHINPLLRVDPVKDEIEQHAPLRETWRQDMQLFSDYLDMKSARTSEGARYIAENGALTGVIREYLQSLLMLKPAQALHFTQHYFSTMLDSIDVPHDEFFDPCSRRVRYYFFED